MGSYIRGGRGAGGLVWSWLFSWWEDPVDEQKQAEEEAAADTQALLDGGSAGPLEVPKPETRTGAEPAPKVSVGRIVHIQHETAAPWPGIVTAVHEDEVVSVTAFVPDGTLWSGPRVRKGSRPGTWCWPPRS